MFVPEDGVNVFLHLLNVQHTVFTSTL